MEEIDVESAHNLGKQAVDVLQRLIVGSQGFDEMGRCLEELLWQNSAADILQQRAPSGDIGAIVRSA
jgi:hypothetical protein